jgi:hypothetical protein
VERGGTQKVIWQNLLEYAKIAWDSARMAANRFTIYDDVIDKYDHVWGGNELLYHRDNTGAMH